ncbi:MAG TPA: 6-pyruvoyl-tetrahydropterin synthase-related protein [Candidatus Elarobacter sp.]|nr:6-pyruvoyl-tetrahydropterin synthase-related protein [Candidatus Elarobacter sp.]
MTSSAELPNKMSAGFREWLFALGVSLGTALLVIAPFFWLGNASGHDFGFHAASWLDAAGQWKEGIFFPRWTEWANHGFGEPRFIFYPPLSWMLGAALSFVAPWNAVPGVFIVIVQTMAGLCSFALARRFLPRNAALFGAACYAANPYALLVVYMRSDFSEQLACALMPLVVLTALQLCGLVENRRRSLSRATAFFALAFAAVWLSNAPASVIASYSAALIFAWAALEKKSMQPLLRGAGGLALGFALASFYLAPAAYEQRWVNIGQVLSLGLQPADNFLYTMGNDPEHNVFNWIASSVAVLLLVMTGIAAIAALQRTMQGQESDDRKKLWRMLLELSAAAAILMVRQSAFFWAHLPKLRFVQFPWRWMAILAVPYAYFSAAAMMRQRMRWIWFALVLIAVCGTATVLVKKTWWDSDDIPSLQEAVANDQGFEGTDEYDPVGDDHTNLPEKSARVQVLPAEESGGRAPQAEIRIERWTAEERVVRVISTEPLRVGLRLLDYPAWHVEVNRKPVTSEHAENNGEMIVALAPGTQRITARFVRTPDRTLGSTISLLGVLTLLALLNAGGVRLLSASP